MKLLNVRAGFATNSSSSHSMIFLDFDKVGDNYTPGEFGLENFTLVSKEAKAIYLACMVAQTIMHFAGPEIAKVAAEKMLSCKIPDDRYIDHQSDFNLPINHQTSNNRPDINQDFLSEFHQFVSQDKLVIIGGNDNDRLIDARTSHVLSTHANMNPFIKSWRDTDDWRVWARKDAAGWWSLFRPDTGSKIRFSLTDKPVSTDKSSVPELVDCCITKMCYKNCDFCYMGATPTGKHAETTDVEALIHSLSRMQTFEITFGGGEPTLHPKFLHFLDYARYSGLVPNFTTRDLSWMKNELERNAIIEKVGAFAYSVSNSSDVDELAALLRTYKIDRHKAVVQVVLGTVTKDIYKCILTAAAYHDLQVTLLGFKETGRGKGFKVIPYRWWLTEYLNASRRPRLSVDTCIASEYRKQILAADVPEWLFTTEEGKFSMFADAVDMRIAPSSYCDEGGYVKVKDFDEGVILNAYKDW